MDNHPSFQWTTAIELNRAALTRVVAQIFAMLGTVSLEALPQALYASVERLLRPTESAVRRLILIAARELVVKLAPSRPMPKGLKIERKFSGASSFRLFDARKTFDFSQPENPLLIKVKTYSSNPFNLFEHYARLHPAPQAQRVATVDASALSRRLAAVKAALENLPHQAKRMARWQARRKLLKEPKFTSPLRPGRPPGHRLKPKLEIDYILQECHGLAWDALRENSS